MTANEILDMLRGTLHTTGIYNFEWNIVIMWAVGCLFIYLAIVKKYEPLLLLPIGFGIFIVNFPLVPLMGYSDTHAQLLRVFYHYGIEWEVIPCIIFLGLGAMTDFGPLTLVGPGRINAASRATGFVRRSLFGKVARPPDHQPELDVSVDLSWAGERDEFVIALDLAGPEQAAAPRKRKPRIFVRANLTIDSCSAITGDSSLLIEVNKRIVADPDSYNGTRPVRWRSIFEKIAR